MVRITNVQLFYLLEYLEGIFYTHIYNKGALNLSKQGDWQGRTLDAKWLDYYKTNVHLFFTYNKAFFYIYIQKYLGF